MTTFSINQQKIEYDEGLEYLVIGVVGSGHGGNHYDVFSLSTSNHFKRLSQRSKDSEFKYDLETNLAYMIKFLETEVFDNGTYAKKLSPEEKSALERGIDLYSRILSAVI